MCLGLELLYSVESPDPQFFSQLYWNSKNAVHLRVFHTMRTKASLSRAVLALPLVWRGATSYTKLGSIVATRPRDVVREGVTERRCFPRPRNAVGFLKSSTGGSCHAPSDRNDGSSRPSRRPPAEGGSSRRTFLRQLAGSSVAVLACSSAVGATRATASAADSVPDGERRGAI